MKGGWRMYAEKVLVGVLQRDGATIKEIVAKLLKIGLTPSDLRELFHQLRHRVYGGGYDEPDGWMLIASHPGDPTEATDFAQVCWSEEPVGAMAEENENS